MAYDIVDIKQVLRRMRGGSQAFLVEGEDDQFYVAKFTGNPQGDRTLINEWIAHRLFQQLGISTPSMRVLRLTENTRQIQALCFQVGTRTVSVKGSLNLGSRCPVDPTKTAIYDFLPRGLSCKVANLADLGSAFVLDTWLGQTDSRQAIFVRQQGTSCGLTLRLYLIDHGMSFGGRDWELRDSPLYGLYIDRKLYSTLDMTIICRKVLSQIDTLAEIGVNAATEGIPGSWFADGDYQSLAKLLVSFERRRTRLRFVISDRLETLDREWTLRSLEPIPELMKRSPEYSKFATAPPDISDMVGPNPNRGILLDR